jgi:hypothetical protein
MKEMAATVAFDEKDARNLRHWALGAPKTKVVLFDWDGTLSVLEGMMLPRDRQTTTDLHHLGISYDDIAHYYLGSKERFQMLRSMFLFLERHSVHVFILTNNPLACLDWKKNESIGIGPLSRKHFFGVLNQFIPQLTIGDVLCGYESNCFKPHTFSCNPFLRSVYERMEKWHRKARSSVCGS